MIHTSYEYLPKLSPFSHCFEATLFTQSRAMQKLMKMDKIKSRIAECKWEMPLPKLITAENKEAVLKQKVIILNYFTK